VTRVHFSETSVYLEVHNDKLIFRCFELQQNVYGQLDHDSYLRIFQYFQVQFEFVIFKILKNQLFLILGKLYQGMPIEFSEVYDFFDEHLKNIIPLEIDIMNLSFYDQLFFGENLRFKNNSVKLGDRFIRFYHFHQLKVKNYNSKIIKVVLQEKTTVLYFGSNSLNGKEFHISISQEGSDLDDLHAQEKRLLEDLQSSPYFSGKIIIVPKKLIIKSPGMTSLGISSYLVQEDVFNNLMLLLPDILRPSPPSKQVKALPQVLTTQSFRSSEQKKVRKPLSDLPKGSLLDLPPDIDKNLSKYSWRIKEIYADSVLVEMFDIELIIPFDTYSRKLFTSSKLT